jgi:glycosyltransferase involved in cell wall biosynthesis
MTNVVKNQRVIFVIENLDFLISHRKNVLELLTRQNNEVYVIYNYKTQRNDTYLEELGVNLILIEFPLITNATGYKQFVLFLRRTINSIKPDLVHAITIKIGFLSLISCAFTKHKLVTSVAGLGTLFIEKKYSKVKFLTSWIIRFLFWINRRNYFIFQNNSDCADLLGSNTQSNRIFFIAGSGVSSKLFEKEIQFPSSLHFTFLGRLTKQKGAEVFIEVARYFNKKFPKVVFNLAGALDDNNVSSLNFNQVKRAHDDGVVSWWGFVENIDELLGKNTSILILPSKREGYPKAIMEAAAFGKCSIVFDVPGCRDAIIHEVNGLICRTNSLAGLINVIEECIEKKYDYHKLGVESRNYALKNYDADNIAAKHEEIYLKILFDV